MDTTELDRQIAEQTLENFVGRFGVAHLRLAQYAALPLILTPELVGFLRSRFLRGQVPWIAEADLLLSDLCRQVGYERFVMESAIRAHLLGSLESESKQEVASLLLHYVAYLVREKRYLTEAELETQQWAAMIYLNDHRETVVNQIMDKFRQLVAETSSRGEGSLYTKMNRLARLVKEFEPQLLKYPEVLEYAKEVGEVRDIRELKSITVPSLSKQPIEAIPLETAIDTPPEIEWFTEEFEVVSISIPNFDVFLCHNSEDKAEVIEIANQLKKRGIIPLLDQWELRPGFSWQELLESQISHIKSVAVFVGSSGQGPWQKRELRAFLNEFTERDCPVIPVLLPNAPEKPQLPIFLKGWTWVDGRRSDALDHLIWGITGVKPSYNPKEPQPNPKDILGVNIRNFSENLGNGVTLEMVKIPAGNFMMGSPENEKDSDNDERPHHQVKVPEFLMGKYQVTQAQWRIVAAMPQIDRALEPDPSNFKGDNLPVENVSWLEAVEFCKRLSEHTGREYKLPSEAEWEYGCRAGTTTAYYFGDDEAELENYAWYDKNSESKTHPVGEKPSNTFGLYDMYGNVFEWCEDDWHDSYTSAPTDGSAWVDNNDNRSQEEVRKLLRGGSWFNFARYCRSACRRHFEARVQYHYYSGFRVVCVLQ